MDNMLAWIALSPMHITHRELQSSAPDMHNSHACLVRPKSCINASLIHYLPACNPLHFPRPAGVVYSGRWQGVDVAAKFIVSDDITASGDSMREAVMSKAVGHPCVVQTYAFFACKVGMGAADQQSSVGHPIKQCCPADVLVRTCCITIMSWMLLCLMFLLFLVI